MSYTQVQQAEMVHCCAHDVKAAVNQLAHEGAVSIVKAAQRLRTAAKRARECVAGKEPDAWEVDVSRWADQAEEASCVLVRTAWIHRIGDEDRADWERTSPIGWLQYLAAQVEELEPIAQRATNLSAERRGKIR